MNENQTTYLLGAGASANAIPCVKDLAKEIKKLFDFISSGNWQRVVFTAKNGTDVLLTNKDVIDNWDRIKEVQKEVLDELESNLSIDTVAKIWYSLDRHEKYLNLKAVLVASFLFWEKPNKVDNRYTNFWATLMHAENPRKSSEYYFRKFYGEINILSWNYDRQLEQSLRNIFEKGKWGMMRSIPDDIFKSTGKHGYPKVFKLNGSAALSDSVNFEIAQSDLDPDMLDEALLRYKLASIILFPNRFPSLSNLRYSWEVEDNFSTTIVKQALEAIKDTKVLVVIGYSFPSLNHTIDTLLINSMENLEKVYFQGYNKEDSQKIGDYFRAVCTKQNLQLIPIDSPGFFIPPEVTARFEVTKTQDLSRYF